MKTTGHLLGAVAAFAAVAGARPMIDDTPTRVQTTLRAR